MNTFPERCCIGVSASDVYEYIDCLLGVSLHPFSVYAISLNKTLYPHCSVLVGYRNRFERGFKNNIVFLQNRYKLH